MLKTLLNATLFCSLFVNAWGWLPGPAELEELCQHPPDWQEQVARLHKEKTSVIKNWLQKPLNNQGYTPLHICVRFRNFGLMEALVLRTGADVNCQADDGQTALHLAASCGNLPMVHCLLACGARMNLADANGDTPLHCAARNGHLPMVQCLIDNGAEVTPMNLHNPLLLAARYRHLRVVQYLLEHGSGASYNMFWLYYYAIRGGSIPIVQCLLEHGAREANDCANDGSKMVDLAVKTGNLMLVNHLLHQGVLPSRTSLHSAAGYGYLPIFKRLLAAGASVLPVPPKIESPLFYAAKSGQLNIIEYWQNHIVDIQGINEEDIDKAIEIAKRGQHEKVVQCLSSFILGLPTLQHLASQTVLYALKHNITALESLFNDHPYPPRLRTILLKRMFILDQ